jgi:hypothetical protein
MGEIMANVEALAQTSFLQAHHLDTILLFLYSPLSNETTSPAFVHAAETPFFRKGKAPLKVEKFKCRANVHFSTGGSLDVHFFLGYQAATHSGPESMMDILNSDRTFVPIEDILMNEVLLIGKTRIMYLEIPEAGSAIPEGASVELPVTVELVNGETLRGSFLTDLPPESRRASDYLNLMPRYICLLSEPHWLVINKTYVLSVKQG